MLFAYYFQLLDYFSVYSVESVPKMELVLSVTPFIFFAICGVVCVKLAHLSYVMERIYL